MRSSITYRINIDGRRSPRPRRQVLLRVQLAGAAAIEIPAHDEHFYALKNVPHGQLRQILYFSKSTNTTRRGFVYTPPDYDKDPTQPLIRCSTSSTATPAKTRPGGGNQGRANLIMDNLIATGKAKPFIIVMDNGGGNVFGGPGSAAGRPGGGGS